MRAAEKAKRPGEKPGRFFIFTGRAEGLFFCPISDIIIAIREGRPLRGRIPSAHFHEGEGETPMEHREQLGSYVYRWNERCFPLGADSLALGEFRTLKSRDRVLDLGCGGGLLLLLCAGREREISLFGVEVDPAAAALARENLAENGLTGEILTGDLRTAPLPEKIDLVISNPPWYPRGSGATGGAGRMEDCSFSELCRAAARVLKPKGRFALVHSPERLTDLLGGLRGAGLEPKRLQFCRHGTDKPPYAVLLEAVKGGKPGLEILPDRM